MPRNPEDVKTLVTGGAGFIGARCAALALELGHEVTVLDDLSTGSQSKLNTLEAAGARVVLGDVRDGNARASALEGVDAVIHLAAQGSVPRSMEDPEATMDVNVHATNRLLEDMAERGLHRLVLASSAAVYGDVDGLPHTEDLVGARQSPYADSKWANDLLASRLIQRESERWGDEVDSERDTLARRRMDVRAPSVSGAVEPRRQSRKGPSEEHSCAAVPIGFDCGRSRKMRRNLEK